MKHERFGHIFCWPPKTKQAFKIIIIVSEPNSFERLLSNLLFEAGLTKLLLTACLQTAFCIKWSSTTEDDVGLTKVSLKLQSSKHNLISI